jgi:hypothetical protein
MSSILTVTVQVPKQGMQAIVRELIGEVKNLKIDRLSFPFSVRA